MAVRFSSAVGGGVAFALAAYSGVSEGPPRPAPPRPRPPARPPPRAPAVAGAAPCAPAAGAPAAAGPRAPAAGAAPWAAAGAAPRPPPPPPPPASQTPVKSGSFAIASQSAAVGALRTTLWPADCALATAAKASEAVRNPNTIWRGLCMSFSTSRKNERGANQFLPARWRAPHPLRAPLGITKDFIRFCRAAHPYRRRDPTPIPSVR